MKSTDEIMGWRGREYSDIESYCNGYFWALEGQYECDPQVRQLADCERSSLVAGIEDGRRALRLSTNRYLPNPVKSV